MPVAHCYLCDRPVDGRRIPPGAAPLCRRCIIEELSAAGQWEEKTDPGVGPPLGCLCGEESCGVCSDLG